MNTSAAVKQDWTHPFERSGFGTAPYRCIGYHVSKFQACPEAPVQPGSSCDVCGTGIMHVYRIRSSEGVEFKVGCDCVQKTGDTALTRSLRSARFEFVNREYLAEKRASKAAREAAAEKVAAEMAETYAFGLETIYRIHATTKSDFVAKFVYGVGFRILKGDVTMGDEHYTDLDGRDVEDEAAKLWLAIGLLSMPESTHFGTVGTRIKGIVATVTNVAYFDSQFGRTYVTTLRTDAGHTLVWKTGSWSGKRGERLTLTATVKAHSEYKGEKQTELSRCKVG